MSVLDAVTHRLRVLVLRERYAREQEREMRFHLALDALAADAETVAAELTPRQRFGSVTYYREEARAMTPLRWLDRIRNDAAYTTRTLRATPGFTLTVVLTLALGFGVNAAIFSMFDSLFLRMPDAVGAPAHLRRLYVQVHRPNEPGGVYTYDRFEYPQYRAVAAANPDVPLAAVTDVDSVALRLDQTLVSSRETEVTGNYFSILQIRPQLGRFFAADEGHVETPAFVAVISDRLWRQSFDADARVIGRRIMIDRRPFTIIGVGPKDFRGIDLEPADVWVPVNTHIGSFSGIRGPWYDVMGTSLRVIGRATSASAEQTLIGRSTNAFRGVEVKGFEYDPHANLLAGSIISAMGPTKPADEIVVAQRVSATALAVLLIACANVINLLLLRAAKRKREIAVRRALGSSRMRLVEQTLIESATLALGGGIVAVGFAYWAGTMLRGLLMPRTHWSAPVIDARTVWFILGLSLLVGVVTGLAPALHGTRSNLIDALRAGSRDVAYRPSRLRSVLLIIQTALCVVLLVGAGLFLRSLYNVRSIGVGYDVDRVALVRPSFADGPFAHPNDLKRVMPVIAEQLSHVPGVEIATYASSGPMFGWSFDQLFLPDRDSLPRYGNSRIPPLNSVAPAFFRATGMRIVAGRAFTDADGASAPNVVVVNETMARLYWPGESAIGKCLIVHQRTGPCATVVGVVSDAHLREVVQDAQSPMYFRPIAQSGAAPLSIVVRLHDRAIGAVRIAAERAFRAQLPISEGVEAKALATILEPQLRPWRLGATLFTAFGVLALLVAGIGVYSVVAYSVSQRTSEMGIRIALGAQTSHILNLILGEGARVVLVGIVLGIGIALAAGRLIASLLYGVGARDPSVLTGAGLGLCIIGIAACLVPALRAAWTDPATALRAE